VHLDEKGQYKCAACGHVGFNVVTPIPPHSNQPGQEDAERRIWLKLYQGSLSAGFFLQQALQIFEVLRQRPLAELRAELTEAGHLSLGPFFPSEAESLAQGATLVGIRAETCEQPAV